jgi:hypothetical protein
VARPSRSNGNGHDPAGVDPAQVKAALASARAFIRENREPPDAIELPDGRTIEVEALGRPLLPDVWTDPERCYLIRRRRDGSFAADWWGYPIPTAYATAEEADEGMADSATRVTLKWSTRPQFGQQTFTMKDVAAGQFLHAFGSPPFNSRRDLAFIVDVLCAQLGALTPKRTPAFLGFSHSPAWEARFVLDGRESWWRIGEDGAPHLEGATAPEPPTLDDAAYLVNAWSEWDGEGRGVACLAFAIRGVFASLRSVGTSLVLTGATGSGKTTAARGALGLFGAVAASAPPTTNFEASAAAMRAVLGRRYDHPTVIDDFHKAAVAGAGAKTADHLDAMFRAIADGGPWSARGTRDGRLRDPVFLKAGCIFTGEELPGSSLLASAERRIAWLPFAQAFDSDTLYAQWDELQAIWERIGHAVIRWALPIYAKPDGPGDLAQLVAAIDQAWEETLFATMREARPEAPQKFARSIAGNWAAILAGAEIADRALGADEGEGPFAETLRVQLLPFALAQLDRLTIGAGAADTFDSEFFAPALDGCQLSKAETGQPFTSSDPADASWMLKIGYQWNTFKDCWSMAAKTFAGWRNVEAGEDWILTEALYETSRKRARALGLAFPFTRQTFPAHLAAIGYIRPGDDGRHTIKPYIPGHGPTRVLRVPIRDDEAAEALLMSGFAPATGPIPYPRSPLVTLPAASSLLPATQTASGEKIVQQSQSGNGNLPASPLLPAATRAGEARARARVGRGAQRAEKPAAIVDAEGLVIAEDSGIFPEPAPDCLLLSKIRRKRSKSDCMTQILDWARGRGVGRIVFAQAWADAAGIGPGGSAGGKWTLSGAGRSQRASYEDGGAAIEVYFPDGKVGDADAVAIAGALARFREITGKAGGRRGFQYRGGVQTFWQIADALARDGRGAKLDQTIGPAAFPAPAHALPEPAADLGFIRAPTETERAARYCVVIDANSQYLRAMGGHRFGVGDPEHHAAPIFDPKAPGYWKATWRGAAWPATLPAPGWPLAEGKAGWLMTETVQLLAEAGAQIDIDEAWLWEAGPALSAVQTRLRDALYALKLQALDGADGAVEAIDMVKRCYKEGVGSMSMRADRTLTVPHPHHRPHWRHAIIARSTALILRDLWRAKAHPVAIAVDGFAFLTSEAPEAFLAGLGLKIGERLGSYQPRPGPPAETMLAALEAWKGAGAPERNHPTRAGVIGLITGHTPGE